MPHRILLCCLCGFLLSLGCAPRPAAETALPADHYFELPLGDATVHAQLALTDDERARGLMHRKALAPDHGMLFVFPDARQRGFWMRNTSIPLDIGYFDDDGRLLEVHRMYPYDETSVPSRSHRIQFALEMNQGWFQANDIRPGVQLPLDPLADAIEARDHSPAAFGLP